MKLRRQLMLVSLMTLCLPWAGCQYIQEMEGALRQGQTNALLASAQAIAARLGDEPKLLQADQHRYDDPRLQLYAAELPSPAIVDGYSDDWRHLPIEARAFATPPDTAKENFSATVRSGFYRDQLYLFITIRDRDIRYHHPGKSNIANGDHVRIETESNYYYLRNSAPGQLVVETSPKDTSVAKQGHGIRGVWVESQEGYQIELQMPLAMSEKRFSLNVVNQSLEPERLEYFTALDRSTNEQDGLAGGLIRPLAALKDAIDIFQLPGLRLRVLNHTGWELADTGLNPAQATRPQAHWMLSSLYSAALKGATRPTRPTTATGRLGGEEITQALQGSADRRWYESNQQQLGSAAAPIFYHNNGHEVIGVVVVERSNRVLLSLTNSAFNRLLLLSMGAALLAGLGLLGYASWLSWRIRRLSVAAQQAVSADGQIQDPDRYWPHAVANDELDELSHHYRGLLIRLQAYTDYLKTLANKLSHELRTPLAVVRSSLDNLEQEPIGDQACVYRARATQGAERLSKLLTAISEASRVESSIQGAECESFSLRRLVREMASAYSDIYPAHTIRCLVEGEDKNDFMLFGSPDLIAQLLDKLMDNAADFSPAGEPIIIQLRKYERSLQLQISNTGPLLPQAMQEQLFDSLVSLRAGRATEGTHMGLGLHIVRLVAQFHGGVALAENLADQSGVRFTVNLPIDGLWANPIFRPRGG